MPVPVVPIAIGLGLLALAGAGKKKAPGEGPIVGVDVELCLEQAAATLGVYLRKPGVAVEPELFEKQGFSATARAMAQGFDPTSALLSDMQAADGATLISFGDELHERATDANDVCIDEPLCFAADCLFAVGSVRLEGSQRTAVGTPVSAGYP